MRQRFCGDNRRGPAGFAPRRGCSTPRFRSSCWRAATAGASWRHRYHRLHLHTHSSYSSLPYFPFPDHFLDYVSAQDLADYYEGVAAHMSEHIRYGAEVVSVELRQLKVPGGVETAAKVKLASGDVQRGGARRRHRPEGTPHVPQLLGEELFGGKTVHSSEWVSGTEYANKSALVVGSGIVAARLPSTSGRAARRR